MAVETPAEAVRALAVMLPGFAEEIRRGDYRVIKGSLNRGRGVPGEELTVSLGAFDRLHIVPAGRGAGGKGGALPMVIAGGLLLATAFAGGAGVFGAAPAIEAGTGAAAAAPGFGGSAFTMFGQQITWGQLAQWGVGLVLSGISTLLADRPDSGGRRNYVFNGIENIAEEGAAIPLVYGERVRVGSVNIANSIRIADIRDDRGSGAFRIKSPDFNLRLVNKDFTRTGTGPWTYNIDYTLNTRGYYSKRERIDAGWWETTTTYESYVTKIEVVARAAGSDTVDVLKTWTAASSQEDVALAGNYSVQLGTKYALGWVVTYETVEVPDPDNPGQTIEEYRELQRQAFNFDRPSHQVIGAPRPFRAIGANSETQSWADLVDLLGEGRLRFYDGGAGGALSSVFLNKVPVIDPVTGKENFRKDGVSGVEFEFREGTADQEPLEGQSASLAGVEVNQEVRQDTGGVTVVIPNQEMDFVDVHLRWPQLVETQKDGDIKETGVSFAIWVKAADEGTFTKVVDEFFKHKSLGPYDRQYRIRLAGQAPWSVKVTRERQDYNDGVHHDAMYWHSYTRGIDAQLQYPFCALVGLKLRAKNFGGNLPTREYELVGREINVPANYDPVGGTYTGIWDGTFKKAMGVTNPAWVLYDLLTDPIGGLGDEIEASLVDKWSLYEIGKYCDALVPDGYGGYERRFTFNGWIANRGDALKVLRSVASAFRGMIYWGNGTVVPTQDSPKEAEILVTNANVKNGEFLYEGSGYRTRHTVAIVTFRNPDLNFETERLTEEDAEGIRAYGYRPVFFDASMFCTSRGLARRIARWLLYTDQYEQEMVSYTAGYDHIAARPGAIIKVADVDYAGVKMGGLVAAGSTTTAVNLDQPVTLEAGETYALSVVMPAQSGVLAAGSTASQLVLDQAATLLDGTLYTVAVTLPDGSVEKVVVTNAAGSHTTLDLARQLPQAPASGADWLLYGPVEEASVTNGTGTYSTLTLASALSNAPLANAEWVLTASNLAPRQFRVVGVREKRIAEYEAIAVEHHPEKYAYVEEGSEFDPPPFAAIATGPLEPPTNISLENHIRRVAGGLINSLEIAFEVSADERAFRHYVELSPDGIEWLRLGYAEGYYRFDNAPAGTYYARARAEDPTGPISDWVTTVTPLTIGEPSVPGIRDLALVDGGAVFDGNAPGFTWSLENPFTDSYDHAPDDLADVTSDPLHRDFEVQISFAPGGAVLRTEYVKQPSYTYSYAKNLADFGAAGSRQVTITVAARRIGAASPGATSSLQVSNPAPGQPSVSLDPRLGGFRATITPAADNDLLGWRIYASKTSGFTPGPSTLVYEGYDLRPEVGGLDLGATYYVVVVPFDGFGDGTASTEESVATLDVNGDTVPPSVPTGVSATGAFQTIFVEWTRPPEGDFSHVEVHASQTDSVGTATKVGEASGSPFLHEGLAPQETWYYWLKAVDRAGNASAFTAASVSAATKRAVADDLADAAVTAAKLAAEAVDATKFASGIEPVSVVTSLPDPSGYTGPKTVLLTTDGKIYRYDTDHWTAEVPSTDISGQLDGDQIADAAITAIKLAAEAVDATKFASGIEPVSVVGVLPNPAGYTGPKTVLLTTDNRLYRYTGSAWDSSTPASSVTGQLTDAQLASISTAKLTGEIVETQIAAGAITTPKIAAGAVTANEIAANAVTANELAANAVTAGKIAANAVTAGTIAANAVTAGAIAAGAVSTTQLAANAVTADKIASEAITTKHLSVFSRSGDNLVYDPSFELTPISGGGIGDWAFSVDNGGIASGDGWLIISSSLGHSGSRLLKFQGVGAASNPRIWTQRFAVTAGQKLFTSVWFRLLSGSPASTIRARPRYEDEAGNYIADGTITDLSASAAGTTWTRHAGITTVPDGAVMCRYMLQVINPEDNILYMFDDLEVRLASSTVTIEDGAITADKLTANAVTAGKIAANAVTSGTIAANAVTAGTIAAGAVSTTQLAANAVTADKIAAGAISTEKLSIVPAEQVVNGGLLNGGEGWTGFSGASFVQSSDPDAPANAPAQWLVKAATDTATDIYFDADGKIPVRAGETYEVSIDVAVTATGGLSANDILIYPRWLRDDLSYISTGLKGLGVEVSANGAGVWATYSHSATAPADAAYCQLRFYPNNAPNSWAAGYCFMANPSMRRAGGSTFIKDGAITTAKLTADAVTANELAANAVIAEKIAAGAVVAGKIAANAVTATEIAADAITTAKIAAGAVTATEIASNAVTATKIAANAVVAGKIAANAVTATQIASNAVTAAKIAAGAINSTHLTTASAVITSSAQIANAVIDTAQIKDLSVDTIKIKDGAVSNIVSALTSGLLGIGTVWEVAQSATINANGNSVDVSFFFAYSSASKSNRSVACDVQIKRGSTVIWGPVNADTALGDDMSIYGTFSGQLNDAPGSGAHTYYVEIRFTDSFSNGTVSYRHLSLQEFKK